MSMERRALLERAPLDMSVLRLGSEVVLLSSSLAAALLLGLDPWWTSLWSAFFMATARARSARCSDLSGMHLARQGKSRQEWGLGKAKGKKVVCRVQSMEWQREKGMLCEFYCMDRIQYGKALSRQPSIRPLPAHCFPTLRPPLPLRHKPMPSIHSLGSSQFLRVRPPSQGRAIISAFRHPRAPMHLYMETDLLLGPSTTAVSRLL